MGFGNKRIAVIGGGLGGMAFANAALYAGLENIQLYEQAPEFTEVGAGVNITKNANPSSTHTVLKMRCDGSPHTTRHVTWNIATTKREKSLDR
jgi:2-polyprenyl-6-methoxyphenol hydroxylase-like FAD-dependent oxidoreductase